MIHQQLSQILAMADDLIMSEEDNDVGEQLIDQIITRTLETYLPWSRWAAGLYAFARWDADDSRVEIGHVISATEHPDLQPVA